MKKIISLAVGSAFAATAALVPSAHAADNPFAGAKLDAGYQLAQADTKGKEGKCGEAKCGGDKKKEAKCGGDKAKEGKCGGDKADKMKEGRCGGDKMKDGKCGGDKADKK